MGWLARQSKLSKFVIGMIMLVGAVASIYAGLGGPPPGKWFSGSNGPGNSVLAEPDISTPTPTPTAAPTPATVHLAFSEGTPTVRDNLRLMFEVARTSGYESEQGDNLRSVAEQAVSSGHYDIAIEAGRVTPYESDRSETLRCVAIHAAYAGRFEVAAEAASEIPYDSVQGGAVKGMAEIKSALDAGNTPKTARCRREEDG